MYQAKVEKVQQKSAFDFIDHLALRMIQSAPIPKHVTYIMDGNRRFAREKSQKLVDGYDKGADSLLALLYKFSKTDMEELSVYAFSVENFKRPSEEVTLLMKLFKDMSKKLIELKTARKPNFTQSINVRFIGNTELLDEEIQTLFRKVESLNSLHNTKSINLCVCYTARYEVAQTVDVLTEYCIQNNLDPEQITTEMVEDTLYTNEIPNPDILIRTSGEIRFSDYMLLQLNHSYLKFLDKLWPEMNGFDTFRIIAMFQYHVLYNKMKESISAFVDRSPQTLKKSERLKQFCRKRKAQTPIMQKPVPEYEL